MSNRCRFLQSSHSNKAENDKKMSKLLFHVSSTVLYSPLQIEPFPSTTSLNMPTSTRKVSLPQHNKHTLSLLVIF